MFPITMRPASPLRCLLFCRHLWVLFLVQWGTACCLPYAVTAQNGFRESTIFSNLPPQTDTATINQLLKRTKRLLHSQPDRALLLATEALTASRGILYQRGIALSLLNMTAYYFNKEEYARASRCLKEATPYCLTASSEDKLLIPKLYLLQASIFKVRGQFDSAIYLFQKSLARLDQDKCEDTAMVSQVYSSTAATLSNVEQHEKAVFYYKKSTDLALQLKDSVLLAQNYMNLGTNYIFLKQPDSARHYLSYAIRLYRRQNNKKRVQAAYINMGISWKGQDNLKWSKIYLDSATREDPGGARSNEFLQQGYGSVYASAGNYNKAILYYKKALAIILQKGTNSNDMAIYQQLAGSYHHVGDNAQAYQYQNIYLELKDSLLNADKTRIVNTLEVQYRSSEKDKELVQKQLLLARREIELKDKNMVVIVMTGAAILCLAVFFSFYRSYRHKLKLQTEKMHSLQHEQQVNILSAQMEGIEKERTRLAQELHDGIGGMLAAVKMNFSILQHHHIPLRDSADYLDTLHLLNSTADEVRKTAHNLMPGLLQQQGLKTALQQYCDKINAGQKLLVVEFQAYMAEDLLTEGLKRAVFLIVQELIQNIVKHAHATHALVQLNAHHGQLQVMVEDNGTGLPVQWEEKNNDGMGLSNLKTRVQLLQGTCFIDSVPGEGTTINLEFYLTKKESNVFL
ncbi:tetratricopeptide repeat-containing sensor histidine kinase [Taibaiella koreensis]|uniref:tetratricopeptide repeat-containing sensor histidine kinase n=1 Tax=Taibaiella koreensis TaxID=1268548 RepID=UPI000E59FF86|nr:sensor histidine kinase [Taibaiella koreensis]